MLRPGRDFSPSYSRSAMIAEARVAQPFNFTALFEPGSDGRE